MIKPSLLSGDKKIGVIEAPFFRSSDRYYISVFVLAACLAPVYIPAAGRLGYKILILLVLTCAAGAATEMLSAWITKKPINYFGIASWLIFPLMVPPGLPMWISIVGFVIGLIVSQTLFGGFGKHLFHPAVFGQIFVLMNFAKQFNSSFLKPFSSPFFGFAAFSSMSYTDKTALKQFSAGMDLPFKDMLMGPHIGLIGEMFPYLIIIAGLLYLVLGDVNYSTPISFLLTFIAITILGRIVFPMALLPPVPAVLGGGTLFYTFFIFSDRWSGSKTVLGRIIAGIMAALLTIIIRSFSSNVEGIMFAAAFNYAFSPLYDELSMFQKRPGKSKV